jgi:hypothetical protein
MRRYRAAGFALVVQSLAGFVGAQRYHGSQLRGQPGNGLRQ